MNGPDTNVSRKAYLSPSFFEKNDIFVNHSLIMISFRSCDKLNFEHLVAGFLTELNVQLMSLLCAGVSANWKQSLLLKSWSKCLQGESDV